MIRCTQCFVAYAPLGAVTADGPDLDWLAGDELAELRRIGDAGRRRQWLAGRVLSRALLRDALHDGFSPGLRILSRDRRQLGTKPRVLLDGRQLDVQLSISHSQRGALAALVSDGRAALGIDLCERGALTAGMLRLWFTSAEHDWIRGDASRAAVAWAIKEAVFKAVADGAAWNPRLCEVVPQAGGGFQCRFQSVVVRSSQLRVWEIDTHVAALACLATAAELRITHANPVKRIHHITPIA
jgi:phosphopantetheinyl transferase